MFDPGPLNQTRSDRVAWLRGSLVHFLNRSKTEDAVACLHELRRLGADRLWEAARFVRALHTGKDPRAEQWLVRLVARIATEHELDLAGLDDVFALAERYATDHEARDALDRYCELPPLPVSPPD